MNMEITCSVIWGDERTDEMSLSPTCRCNGGVLRVRCGGVPCFPDIAHHRGKNTGIFRERQNRGAALPTSPVSHAASSQARMQRQTAPGGARAQTHFSLRKLLRLFLKCRQMEVYSHFLACFLLLLFVALSIKWGTLTKWNALLLYCRICDNCFISVIVQARLTVYKKWSLWVERFSNSELRRGLDNVIDKFHSYCQFAPTFWGPVGDFH